VQLVEELVCLMGCLHPAERRLTAFNPLSEAELLLLTGVLSLEALELTEHNVILLEETEPDLGACLEKEDSVVLSGLATLIPSLGKLQSDCLKFSQAASGLDELKLGLESGHVCFFGVLAVVVGSESI